MIFTFRKRGNSDVVLVIIEEKHSVELSLRIFDRCSETSDKICLRLDNIDATDVVSTALPAIR